MKANILLLLSICLLTSCIAKVNSSDYTNKKQDSLEKELLQLKNQAFCNCFNQAMRKVGAKLMPADGSSYIQISDLVLKYSHDKHLKYIIEKWNKKDYSSYSEDNKLYLMRCLDFYNSKDLELYIDSVRQIESNATVHPLARFCEPCQYKKIRI